jgi:hypothetical protein
MCLNRILIDETAADKHLGGETAKHGQKYTAK